MNVDEIRKLIKILEESEVGEITVEEEGVRITVRKRPTGVVSEAEAIEEAGEGKLDELSEVAETKEESYPLNWKEVVAPMVGTFYRASAPDAPFFVEVGDEVEPGQPLCILEAMKLMNELTAEERGVIKKILVENGHPVEYGQTLFLYEPL